MKRTSLFRLFMFLLFSTRFALAEQTADELVQSKRQENINYRQLMEMLGAGSSLIHDGIIRENQSLVATGTDMIMFHPAPNHKPWEIVAQKDQEDFKNTLLAYDLILHKHADAVITYAEDRKWLKASESAEALNQSCISCHMAWKHKVIHFVDDEQNEEKK